MPRTRPLNSPLFLAAVATLLSTQAAAQELHPTGLSHWDSTNQVLFFGDGSSRYVLRAYVDAHQRGADINVSKDFPGLQETFAFSVTAGPDGATIVAAELNFVNHGGEFVLTYDSSGRLLKTWDPAPQFAEAIAYSSSDDAIFVLGERELPTGPYAQNYPLLTEFSRDGRLLKTMIPSSILKDHANSFHASGETGEPALKVTQNRIYIYAPTNREVLISDRNGTVLVCRSISDILERISTEDGYHLVQIHNMDFSEDGDVVVELLRSNDIDYTLEVVRINIKSGEASSVHKSFNSGPLWFIGLKDGQYVYIENGQRLVIQSSEAQDPLPFASNLTR